MCVGCFESIATTFLYATNLIVFFLAVAVLGLSVWVLVDRPSFLNVIENVGLSLNAYQSIAILLIVFCGFVIFVTFFGCCGANKNSKCMLITYFVLLTATLIGISAGTYFLITGDIDKLKKPFFESLQAYNPDSNNYADEALVQAWDKFQTDFQCCGVDSWKDWSLLNEHFGSGILINDDNLHKGRRTEASVNPKVPKSCCDPEKGQTVCSYSASTVDGIRSTGCFGRMAVEVEEHSNLVGGICIGIILVMLVDCLISLYLATCGQKPYGYGMPPTRSMI